MQDFAIQDEERFVPVLQTLYSAEMSDDTTPDDGEGGQRESSRRERRIEEEDDEEWMKQTEGMGGGEEEEEQYEDDYEEYEEVEEERQDGDHVATRVSFAPRLVSAVHHIEPYRTADLPSLFYSEREILLLQMEAEGPLPNDDDEGGPRTLSSNSEARIETIVFSDTDSDDGF